MYGSIVGSHSVNKLTCEGFCVINSCIDKSSPRAVDGRQLVIARPTPPSRLLLRPVSRQQQQQAMLSWHRVERSQSVVDNDRLYVQAPRNARKHECFRRGLVICLCAQPLAAHTLSKQDLVDRNNSSEQVYCSDSRAKHSHVTRYDISSDCEDRVSSQPRNTWQRTDHTSSRRFIADDAERRRGEPTYINDEYVKRRQSQLMMVDYNSSHQQTSTHTLTDTSLDSVRSPAAPPRSGEWSTDSHLCYQRPHQQQQQQGESESASPSKKRLTLSCVMADFSGLLRRMRHLRIGRAGREHETRV